MCRYYTRMHVYLAHQVAGNFSKHMVFKVRYGTFGLRC